MGKNVLITGGAGFVGSHLADGALNKGYKVRVLDNLDPQVHGKNSRVPDYLNKEVEFIKGDIRNIEIVEKAIKGIDYIFHDASAVGVGQSMYKIRHYIDVNDTGTAALWDVLINKKNRIKKLVIASSMSIYGEGAYVCKGCGPVYPKNRTDRDLKNKIWECRCPFCNKEVKSTPTNEDKPLNPTSVYALSKKQQEDLCLLIGRTYKIPTVALRYFNIYGPRQALSNPYTGVAAIFSSSLLNNNRPIVYEDGMQTRDYVHVKDIVRANLMAIENSNADYDLFNVGSERPMSVLGLAKILIKNLKRDLEPKVFHEYRSGDIRHCYADCSKIKSKIGFKTSVKFEDGIKDLINWVVQQKAKDLTQLASEELKSRGLCI